MNHNATSLTPNATRNQDQEPSHDPTSSTSSLALNTPTAHSLAQSLITRCRALLAELDALKSLLAQTQRNPQIVEVRSLRSNVLSELKTLEKLSSQLDSPVPKTCVSGAGTAAGDEAAEGEDTNADADADAACETKPSEAELRTLHALKSSNLPFYEAVWTIAKRTCTGLVAFGKRFYFDTQGDKGKDSNKGKGKRKSVFVDIVSDDGEEWVKVSTTSETRLLFEMAKKGWEGDETEDEDGEERTVLQNHDGSGEDSEDEDDEIELLKLAGDMRKAASLVRVNYRRPRLRFVIPKIVEGASPEIDDLIRAIRAYGVVATCGEEVFASQTEGSGGPQTVQDEVRNLLPNRFKRFTPTLNVDCTLLLAIISDLSHCKTIEPSSKHHKAINRQIEIERERPLLPTELWPAMEAHDLICTSEAAKRMREIVDTIGTETERKRMTILMGDQVVNPEPTALAEELQKLSDYQVPSQLNLPIKVVDAGPAIEAGKSQAKLPPIAQEVEKILSDINTSVFMYGWVSEIMTVTSNRTVVKQVENMIESQRDVDDLKGPLIWVCDTARSLIGKEKGRKDRA